MASVFFSYSHVDEDFRNALEEHLAMLKRNGLIDTWHDRRIDAGDNIDKAIDERINQDDIILLLVSPAFLNSRYCFDIELQRAMERHEAKEAKVIPVILRPCDWTSAPFGKLLALPTDGRPVSKWPDRDDAFLDIVQGIRRVAEGLKGTNHQETLRAPAEDVSVLEQTSGARRSSDGPRSSNLRLPRQFSQREKDQFIVDAFAYIARYFENSLRELGERNKGIEGVFRHVDSSRFFATVYRNGDVVARCTVYEGGPLGSGIYYLRGESRDNGSYNESLSVDADDHLLHLHSLGMAQVTQNRDAKLSLEGGAELLWSLLIGPLQMRHF